MRLEEARRALWQDAQFEMVPQRMIGIIDHLLDMVDVCWPALPFRLSPTEYGEKLDRKPGCIVDTLTWMEEYEFASITRDGDEYVVQLQPPFLYAIGLVSYQEPTANHVNQHAECVVHRLCG